MGDHIGVGVRQIEDGSCQIGGGGRKGRHGRVGGATEGGGSHVADGAPGGGKRVSGVLAVLVTVDVDAPGDEKGGSDEDGRR